MPDESPNPDYPAETPNGGITTTLPFQPWAGRFPLEKQGIMARAVIEDVGTRRAMERPGHLSDRAAFSAEPPLFRSGPRRTAHQADDSPQGQVD